MSPPRILVVDDEPQIHRFLRPALEAEGYAVERADSGASALRAIAHRPPDAVLLDLGLPDIDGQDVLLQLRGGLKGPVLVVSARGSDDEKVRALDHGADDYVEKPFSMPELLARLRACLRRAMKQDGITGPWSNGALAVDMTRRTVEVAEQAISLTAREYDLLTALVRHAGRVVTHGQLLTMVWGASHRENVQYLRVYVGHLRQKLGPIAGPLIQTEMGVGYRLLEAS